jgi:CDP-4-dehydro-6-deoxyglucose reductase
MCAATIPLASACTVRVEPSGKSFSVRPGETVLEAALRQGLALPYSCRGGSCGSCRARLLSGRIHYPQGRPKGISDAEAGEGYALLCQADPLGDLQIQAREVAGLQELAPRTLPCRVVKKERLCHDVMRLYLKLPDTERLQFLAGQYIDILLKDGRRRAFSLANAPHDDRFLELHIRHVPGGRFTDFVFHELQEKALLRMRGPLGSFYLREESDLPIVFLAGGTGFAPVKGIIEHALACGIRRPMHLYWGVRARRDLYLDALARAWTRAHENLRYTPVLSEPLPEDAWRGRTGLVHEAVLADLADLGGHEVYASGPPVMVKAARETFLARGLDPEHLFSDAFEFAYEAGQD